MASLFPGGRAVLVVATALCRRDTPGNRFTRVYADRAASLQRSQRAQNK